MPISLSCTRVCRVLLVVGAVALASLALGHPSAVFAQPPAPTFEHVFDLGSPGLQVFHQDQHGFLWIGSRGGGLFRYDGYQLKNYGAGPGQLSNGYIYGLIEDPLDPNVFWIATKGGLNRLDRQIGDYVYYQHNPDDPDSLAQDGINATIQDGQDPNLLWVGSDGGLDRFDKQAGTFTHYRPNPDAPNGLLCPQVWRIVEDSAAPDLLWIGTWGCGLYRFDKRTGAFTPYLHDPADPDSLSAEDNLISALAQDRDDPNLLWIGTMADGLDRFDQRTETFTHYVHDPQNSASIPDGVIGLIYDDGQGRLWLGGWVADNGLAVLDKTAGVFTNYIHDPADPQSLSDDQIVNVYQDRSGIVWIVTFPGQVDKFDPWKPDLALYQHDPHNPASLLDNAVTVIYEDRDGGLWLGTQGGLARFDPRTGAFTNYVPNPDDPDSLPANYVWDIQEDTSGDLWISHFAGPLARFDPQTGRVVAVYREGMESFLEIIQDPRDADVLWIGTRPGGLVAFNQATETFTFYEPHLASTDKYIGSPYLYVGIHDRQEDVLWLGGWEGGGLVRFDKQTGAFTRYLVSSGDPQNLHSDVIATIYQDESGRLWIGTLGGGLETFDKTTETFTYYTRTHGVPAMIYAVLEDDDGAMWLSTDSGIVQFNPRTERAERRYTQADGLQGDAFLSNSALKAGDGGLWFGGTNGVNRFYPDELVTNPYVPPVVLTSFTQGGDPFPPGAAPENLSEVRLDWQHNFFEFECAALNYTQPEKNQYAYMLEGVDRDWYDAGARRFGRYTGLRGGTYALRIKGSNNDGVWNEEGVAVRIVVEPPFWQTGWFYALCAAGVLGVLGAIYQVRAQKLRAEREAAQTLRESEERLRRVVQNMPVMMDAFDADTKLLVWNRECERVTGYSAEEMIGNSDALALLYPDPAYREHVMITWQEREQDLRSWESEIACQDGSTRTVAWSNISRQFPIPGWYEWAIGVDVTERKRAEAERERLLSQIQFQARRMQQVLDTVPEGVFLLHADGRIVLANPVAETGLAILARSRVGDVVTRLGDRPLAELLTSPPRGLWHEARADGHIFEIVTRPMENGPEPEDWVVIVRDVTKARETQLWTQQQERLVALGQLASGIAHDFNNIMATIVLYAQMAARTRDLPDRLREWMETINQQAQHATRLIQQILDFSRRAVLDRCPVDLLPLVKEQIEIFRRTLPENIQVELSYGADIYTVHADPTRVQQVLMNLAVNARDAMPDGGTLRVELEIVMFERRRDAPLPEMEPGKWVKIVVADTGTGIPADVLPHIFDPFFTTKSPRVGSGLGLSQVHGIVVQHTGYVHVESEVGAGTTFTVYLPALEANPIETLDDDGAPLSSFKGSGETILLVEDNEVTRTALATSLESLE
jgi:PAS domain S-box-containing protein